MIVDSSALIAIVFGEDTAEELADALLATSEPIRVSAATIVESTIVVEARQGPDAVRDLQLLLTEAGIEVTAFDAEQATLAVTAWRRFGKGRHPAALNLGDCYSYALAAATGEPLLFTGGDFAQTDIPSVLH